MVSLKLSLSFSPTLVSFSWSFCLILLIESNCVLHNRPTPIDLTVFNELSSRVPRICYKFRRINVLVEQDKLLTVHLQFHALANRGRNSVAGDAHVGAHFRPSDLGQGQHLTLNSNGYSRTSDKRPRERERYSNCFFGGRGGNLLSEIASPPGVPLVF